MIVNRFLIIFLIIVLSSCSSSREGEIFRQFSDEDVQVGTIEDESILIEMAYIGAIGHSYIFECYVKNHSDESLFLDKSQFTIETGNQKIIYPISEDEIIANLTSARKALKKRKKTSTILGGIAVGLSVLAGATNGVPAGEALVYNADPVIGIFDERRWYQRNIESVEDEIEYIRNAQFKYDIIPPGEEIVRDVLFPTVHISSDVNLVAEIENNE